jgi:glycine cleavage system H protein
VADYDLPEDKRYSKGDEWVSEREPGVMVIGISDYAQQQLGDVVFVELPEVGAHYAAEDPFGVIESVKAVSDLYAPLAGEILEVNSALEDTPETVNSDCYGEGWLIVVKADQAGDLGNLMDVAAYRAYIDERGD